jgi:hypothetical protein
MILSTANRHVNKPSLTHLLTLAASRFIASNMLACLSECQLLNRFPHELLNTSNLTDALLLPGLNPQHRIQSFRVSLAGVLQSSKRRPSVTCQSCDLSRVLIDQSERLPSLSN